MSFVKAEQLLALATMATARYSGVTLEDVIDRFEVSKRTAQRMLHALENSFSDVETYLDEERHKRWRLRPAALRDLLTLTPDELAALDAAMASLKRRGQNIEATQLASLKDKIRALVPRSMAARLETDHEALLEAQGLVARPGPRPKVDPDIARAVADSIKACRYLSITYRSRGEKKARRRQIAPYGVLTGLRRYIVARPKDDPEGPMRLYRAESVHMANVTAESFTRDPSFSLTAFANRAFGVFQNDDEYDEVVWRFAPEAAEHARGFEFHPEQTMEDDPDGSLIVRFRAAGRLEMCWHLYAWGDKVEVMKPKKLKAMAHRYRRNDFPAMP